MRKRDRIAKQLEDARRNTGATLVDGFFRGLSRGARVFPQTRPEYHGLRMEADIPYLGSGDRAHLLDVYRPDDEREGLPVVFYIHGGGFRILSKDSHWVMGLAFARRDYVVFNVDYRKAPHRYPAAHEDVSAAYRWVLENAERFGGDPNRIVVAGESAGANLATSLVIASCWERPEPWAREVFETGRVPSAAVPACGILQVSDPERFVRRKNLPRWLVDRLEEVATAYLQDLEPGEHDLADPLLVLEAGGEPQRPMPPFFVPVGTKDPLLDDSRRLGAALDALGVPADVRYYPGGVHAFHAFVWQKRARACWRATFDFLDESLP